jgi:catechol 2,3-dioxygenase-like lactoylglutathione lyase family enzyme
VKRFHVHLHVGEIETSVKFYSALFGVAPTKHKPDYAKWMLDAPAVNFAISKVDGHVGLSHLGFEVDDEDALAELSTRARHAGGEILIERRVHCGYARGNKSWTTDPQGVRWENFHTYESELETFGCGAEETWREDHNGERTAVAPACATRKT